MYWRPFIESVGTLVTLGSFVLAGMLSCPGLARADDKGGNADDPRIQRGFEIAPVELNLRAKNRDLVGLGSYLVNAVGGCNDCHTADPTTEFTPGGNPYFGQPKVINQATYLGGGRNFGPLAPDTPAIVSRNLTPDKTGYPAGGRTFEQFLQIMRTGEDLDHLHPPCSRTVTTNCFPPQLPFDGNLLQIMPWPTFQSMTVHDLRAIYEYLAAVPCVEGPPAPSVLHNDCT